MQGIDGIFYFLVLIISIVFHEVAHGAVADRFGDPTARIQRRLSLNPIRHIDLFGSIILPLLLILSQAGIVIGWAKPVPYNPDLLRNKKISIPLVAIAGILVNLAFALIFGILIRLGTSFGIPASGFYEIGSVVVLVNIVLALFNAVPLPPLDGFRFIFSVLPVRFQQYERKLESYGMILLIVFIIFGWKFVAPIAISLFRLFTGIPL